MKKILRILCLAGGGTLIGAFANQLNTANGAALFTLGILLAVCSMITISKKETPNETNKTDKK